MELLGHCQDPDRRKLVELFVIEVRLSVRRSRKTYSEKLKWLAIGESLEDESFLETTIREVAWSLRLDRKRDFPVSNMAQMNLEFVDLVLE